MRAKKPVRRTRKKTHGRAIDRVLTAIRSNRWTGTSGTAVAVAFAVLVGVLGFAYTATAPLPERAADRTTAAVQTETSDPQPANLEQAPPKAATAVARVERPAREAAPPASANGSELRRVERTPEETPMPVTLTGCLARSDNEFHLKDTSGTNVPKARSWKSGFLTRRAASIAIVPEGALPLSSHVGQRVTVSGTLVDREMRVQTLRTVSSSCAGTPRVKA